MGVQLSVLWFAESFGLIPESMSVRTSGSGEVFNVPLSNLEQQQSSSSHEERKVDEYVALQTLYLLDRFGVPDEFYHELTQVQCGCMSTAFVPCILLNCCVYP